MLKEGIDKDVSKNGALLCIVLPDEIGFKHRDRVRIEQPNEYTLIMKKYRI